MPSTYTLNNGIELISTGEQSGTWGDTTNTNLSLLDTALDGQVTVTLPSAGTSGSPNTLAITDGAASDGRNRMVTFADGGDLGATAYVQLTPNDSEKIIYVRNTLAGSRSIILFQGTYNASNDYEVPAGTTAVVYFDGAGSGAVAANVFNNAYFDSLRLGGVSVTAIIDDDTMGTATATNIATSESIKAYVDAQVGANNELSEVLANGNTTGGNDILFGDNDKAIFGAGSDLQIYHDGSNSYISDQGTGNIILDADDSFQVKRGANTSAVFDTNAEVTLYHNNSPKLATTSTGIDVTGTVTADGLTVDGDIRVNTTGTPSTGGVNAVLADTSNASAIQLHNNLGVSDGGALLYSSSAANFNVYSYTGAIGSETYVNRFGIANNGDISFYEDTGTTAKFFWDASSESLGIGTTSPAFVGGGNPELTISGTISYFNLQGNRTAGAGNTTGQITSYNGSTAISRIATVLDSGTTDGAILFSTASSGSIAERMRIDSSGNVGIGTSSPAFASGKGLVVHNSTAAADTRLRLTNAANGTGLYDGLDITLGADGSANLIGWEAQPMKFYTSATERMRIDSNGRVAIGGSTVTDVNMLNIQGSGASSNIGVVLNDTNTSKIFSIQNGSSALKFFDYTASAERMRIDSSGNLLVGKTSESGNTAGHFFSPTGYQRSTRNGAIQILNRISSDGAVIDFQRDGSAVGSINITNSTSVVSLTGTSSGGGIAMGKSAANVYPARPAGVIDNTLDFGSISYRWDDIYATNGTIQTSDRNEKQNIEALSDAEQRVAVACKGLLRKFRWIDAVEEKGDDARIHFGIIAQDLQDAFAAEGLDAGDYAMFISSTWWEATETYTDDDGVEQTRVNTYETAEEAPEGATERTRLGVRYPELLAFIIAAI